METTNIPQNVIKAILYIIALDNLQLSVGSGGVGTHKYEDWHWTPAESAYVTSLRLILEPLKELYSNKKNITTGQRDTVKKNIRLARDYSGHGLTGHRLLLKIAAFGTDNDWTVANIKLGTSLAKTPGKGKSESTAMLQPVLTLTKNKIGEMEISVASPEAPSVIRLPEGMRFAKVFRSIGTTMPTSTDAFVLYGNAKRGKIHVKFDGLDLSGTEKLYAWFYGIYESTKGELGQPSGIISAEILF